MDSDELVTELSGAEANADLAIRFLRDLGVDIGLLKRAYEGCKAWVADFECTGLTEVYMSRQELRAAARSFTLLAEAVERASVPGKCPDGGACRLGCVDGRCLDVPWRGTRVRPCESCGNTHTGNDRSSLNRCNTCGYPGK